MLREDHYSNNNNNNDQQQQKNNNKNQGDEPPTKQKTLLLKSSILFSHHPVLKLKHKLQSRRKFNKQRTVLTMTPPINCNTLKELSVPHIFKSIQLRHDLLFDPHLRFRPNLDGPTGRDKRKQADRYWQRVDRAFLNRDYDYLQAILEEISRILVSLMHHSQLPWPADVTCNHIHDVLDSGLIIQQLIHKQPITSQIQWLRSLFITLSPSTAAWAEAMCVYFNQRRYAKGLKQCFHILESIHLHCANRLLGHYRNFLIETCAEFEYRCFVKHEYKLDSVVAWIALNKKRCDTSSTFEQVYYHGLVHLVTDDDSSHRAWPITLQFDQRRMTHQFRYEFQTIMVMSIVKIAYRQLSRNTVKEEQHIQILKAAYADLTKSQLAICTPLATCMTSLTQHPEQLSFWQNWLLNNLVPDSKLYQLIYQRLIHRLVSCCSNSSSTTTPTTVTESDKDVLALGKKLKLVASLNLQTFGQLYKTIVAQSTE